MRLSTLLACLLASNLGCVRAAQAETRTYETQGDWSAFTGTDEKGVAVCGVTPAMAAGVSKTLWTMDDVVRVVEEWEMAQ
jgi:hypothetical protein